ncbi:MAG: hypothetical protein R6U25_11665, partial [Alkalispirochaeta sp.]
MTIMKSRLLLISVVVALLGVSGVFAQNQEDDDVDMQVMTVYVQTIYQYSQGYHVIYNRTDLYPGEVYLPSRWFTNAAGKGEILYTAHPSAPYMNVFYENGEFSHVRLYAPENRAHRSWGAPRSGQDLSEE